MNNEYDTIVKAPHIIEKKITNLRGRNKTNNWKKKSVRNGHEVKSKEWKHMAIVIREIREALHPWKNEWYHQNGIPEK